TDFDRSAEPHSTIQKHPNTLPPMIESKNSDEAFPATSPTPAKAQLGLIRSVSGEALAEVAQILHKYSKANLECEHFVKGAQKRVNNGKVYGAYSRDGELMGFICGTKWGRLGILGELQSPMTAMSACFSMCFRKHRHRSHAWMNTLQAHLLLHSSTKAKAF